MVNDKNKFDIIAEVCMTLSLWASTVEERDTFLAFALRWTKMASEAKRLPISDRQRFPKKAA